MNKKLTQITYYFYKGKLVPSPPWAILNLKQNTAMGEKVRMRGAK
jgi:hypothetical protein